MYVAEGYLVEQCDIVFFESGGQMFYHILGTTALINQFLP